MIHIHIDNNHPTSIDIYIDSTSSSIISNKKKYTVQQIHDNVETIQNHYEEILENSIQSSSSCFFTFKKLTKIFKIFRTKSIKQSNQLENKSPFIFGGETLQWIALPQYNDLIH